MSLEVAVATLRDAFVADADIRALLGGKPLTPIEGNTEVAKVPANQLPALVLELDDGQTGGATVGGGRLLMIAPILVALWWAEQNPAQAFAQRLALPRLVARLVMRNPTLGVAGGAAWLRDFAPDRAANHPKHLWRCGVHFEYQEAK